MKSLSVTAYNNRCLQRCIQLETALTLEEGNKLKTLTSCTPPALRMKGMYKLNVQRD